MKKILVFNTGSSSIKYKLFEFSDQNHLSVLKRGLIDRIGLPNGPKNHIHALSLIFQGIGSSVSGLSGIPDLVAIGHRVVHCGDKYNKTTIIDKNVIKLLRNYNLVAPLHNPRILEVMKNILDNSGRKGHRDIPNYAVFDSVFYKDLPSVTKIYPLPYEYYQRYGIQRFGFHGISHQYVTENILNRYPMAKRIISIHLGAGSSMTATCDGKPIDTSMGFTPLEGLMMVTRSGNIDTGIVHYLIEKKYLGHRQVDKMLNFESGMVGITGLEADMMDFLHIAGYKVEDANYKPRIDVEKLDKQTIDRVKLALEMYVYRVKKYIGEYYAILGGLDVLVFTGKIGFGSSVIRNKILKDMNHIVCNSCIEAIETDEEIQIAKEILKII